MGAEIDRLEVQVEAQASKASHQIDTLIGKLSRLSGVLSGVNSGGFSNMAAGVRNLSAAMKTMEGIKTSDFTRVSKGIQELSKLNTTNLYRASNAIRNFSNSMSAMSGLSVPNIEAKNIDSIVKTMKKLDGIGTTNASQSAHSIKNIADAMAAFNGVNVSNTGVTNFTNALRRMLSIDLSKFDSGEFSKIAQSMSLLGSMPDVSNSLNRFVSSLARLSGTGDSMSATAKALPELSSNLSKTIRTISGAGDISDSTNMFVQSIGRLAAAGNKTNQTASGLENLANETVHFMNILSTAPSVNQSVVNMVQALAQLASAGGKAGSAANSLNGSLGKLSGSASFTGKTMKSMASTTISAFSKVTGAVSKVTVSLTKLTVAMLNPAGTAKRMGSAVASAFEKIGIGSKHIDTATFSLKNLFRAIIPLMGVRQLFNWGKQAVEISSDLTEVQNVVDTTFGDFKQKIEDFASVSIQNYGMSELTSKQIASRFQAMGVAMGFSQGKMSDMSVELTKLAADMASFYNVEQSDVAESLESIFTGQTRPLRQYGLDLTQATVQEWAMKQGIDANMQSMSQASKTLLRYQYVLANTTAAQGDFARTSNTWANQTRILGQSFQVLGSTIGEVLINAFKPLVSWLNNVMLKVISVVETIGNALGAIFGWTIEVSSGGATSGYDDMADGIGSVGDAADGAGSSLGNAADKAKELKAALMGFDEINKLPDYSDVSTGSGGSGGSGAGSGSGGGTSGTAQIVRTDSLFEKYKSEIKSLEELGSYIGEALTAAMNNIPWENVYRAAENFGTGLAEFLNGLISPSLFDALGATVSGGINTALHALDSFGDTFDWNNFGKSLGTGLDKFLKTLDLELAANTLSTFANGIATTIISGSEAVSWGNIGDKIATSMNTFLKKTSWSKVGEAVTTGINDMFKLASTWSDKFDFSALGDAVKGFVNGALSNIEWKNAITTSNNIGKGIADALNTAITPETFGNIGSTVAGAVNTAVSGAHAFLSNTDFKQFADSVASGINTFIGNVSWENVGQTIGTGLQKALDFCKTLISGLKWSDVKTALQDLWKGISESVDMGEVGKIMFAALGAWLAANAATSIASSVLSSIGSTIATSIAGALATGISTVGFGTVAAAVGAAIAGIFVVSKVTDWLKDVNWKELGQKISDLFASGIGVMQAAVKAGVELVKNGWETVTGWISGLGNAAKGAIDAGVSLVKKGWDTVSGWLNGLGAAVNGTISAAVSLAKKAGSWAADAWTALTSGNVSSIVSTGLKKASTWVSDAWTALVSGDRTSTVFAGLKKASTWISDAWSALTSNNKTTSVSIALKKAAVWIRDAWKVVSSGASKAISTTVKLAKKAGGWAADAWKVVSAGAGKAISATVKLAKKAGGWAFDAWKVLSSGTSKAISSTVSLAKKAGGWAADAWKVLSSGAIKTITSSVSLIKKGWYSFVNWLTGSSNGTVTVGVTTTHKTSSGAITGGYGGNFAKGGLFSGGSWRPITAAANGGSFNMGQMFIAREAGPELVGTLGGHTAVMNNDQIVASVSAGVYQAVSAAMSQFSQNSSGGTPVFNIYVGGKKVTDVVVEEVNRRTMATGICPIMT